VGPEHMLLGLIREGSGVASVALNNLGLTFEKARKLLRKFE
jgi:ATP-dependent Clp protease ATP-binding subunit ClpC